MRELRCVCVCGIWVTSASGGAISSRISAAPTPSSNACSHTVVKYIYDGINEVDFCGFEIERGRNRYIANNFFFFLLYCIYMIYIV